MLKLNRLGKMSLTNIYRFSMIKTNKILKGYEEEQYPWAGALERTCVVKMSAAPGRSRLRASRQNVFALSDDGARRYRDFCIGSDTELRARFCGKLGGNAEEASS